MAPMEEPSSPGSARNPGAKPKAAKQIATATAVLFPPFKPLNTFPAPPTKPLNTLFTPPIKPLNILFAPLIKSPKKLKYFSISPLRYMPYEKIFYAIFIFYKYFYTFFAFVRSWESVPPYS
jgi:hypothetical protein